MQRQGAHPHVGSYDGEVNILHILHILLYVFYIFCIFYVFYIICLFLHALTYNVHVVKTANSIISATSYVNAGITTSVNDRNANSLLRV